MIEIKQIATVEELYQKQGARTGEVIVDAVVEMLKEGPRTNAAKDYAQRLGLELRVLNAVMEKLVGVRLKEMIMQWRMLQALDLLDNPELSYDQVAQQCGFSTAKELGKEFARRQHTTIGVYRSNKLRLNTNYNINQRAETRRKVCENATKLRNRTKITEG